MHTYMCVYVCYRKYLLNFYNVHILSWQWGLTDISKTSTCPSEKGNRFIIIMFKKYSEIIEIIKIL